jgi:hypothetical protein
MALKALDDAGARSPPVVRRFSAWQHRAAMLSVGANRWPIQKGCTHQMRARVRLAALLVAAGLVVGMTASGLVSAAPVSAATTGTECTEPTVYLENVEGAWLSATVTSPDPSTIITTKSAAVTYFCTIDVSGNIYKFEQYGTYRCMTIDTTYRTLYTGNCNSTEAEWNVIDSTAYVGGILLENWYKKACVYQLALGGDATYNPCQNKGGVTSDVWLAVVV